VTTLGALEAFADEIGPTDPVAVEGGRTQWHIGGALDAGARVVQAPVGVVAYQPAEMTVRVRAGTTLDELHAVLAMQGQTTVLEGAPGATVGGVLAVGANGLRRLRVGPLRDALLEARYVSADGRLVTAGGPTVKNVTGYDLCRLLVGSLGTLGFVGEVVLRTRPLPQASVWLAGPTDPDLVVNALYRPSCVLWDGATTWALIEGYAVDVDAQHALLTPLGLREVDGPPPLPPVRRAVAPADVARLAADHGRFVAEIGVGVIHCDEAAPPVAPSAEIVELHRRLKSQFDPTCRCNPGRDPLRIGSEVMS
jgi:glycolate oxidase FAD binding subunit